MHAWRNDVLICFADCPCYNTVANESAIDKKILRIPRCALLLRFRDEAPNTYFPFCLYLDQFLYELRAEKLIGALTQCLHRRGGKRLSAVMYECEIDMWIGKRVVSDE